MSGELRVSTGAGIGVTGATGMVGGEVCRALEEAGYRVVRFSRDPSRGAGGGEVRRFSLLEPPDFSGLEAVVHLAGESIHGFWTKQKKAAIWNSRMEGTRQVVEGIRRAGSVRVLLNASAIGFYGMSAEGRIDETRAGGEGFLAELCQAWEAEAEKATSATCRVVRLRIGMVLGRGGALGLIGPVFRWGLGGRLGSGRQWIPPVHVAEIGQIAKFLLVHGELAGAVNVVMPEPVTNAEFTREVAGVLGRPAPWVVPSFALRLVLGGLADLLLGSLPVVPRRLEEAGYEFRFPALRPALEDVLLK